MSTNKSKLQVFTPEILWHGGFNELGKPDPVFSIDFHPTSNLLITSGLGEGSPTKGSVRVRLFAALNPRNTLSAFAHSFGKLKEASVNYNLRIFFLT